MKPLAQIPLIGFVGPSGTGKTTLITAVIRLLTAKGYRIAAIKHSHHRFDIDTKGKDSYRMREAGATQVLVGSNRRFALIVELPQGQKEPNLKSFLEKLDSENTDLIVVEGFKHEHFPKIEVARGVPGDKLLFKEDDDIVAIATDQSLTAPIPVLDLNNPEEVAGFVMQMIRQE